MSTFGKKSLVWWDYHNRDRAALLRFNKTPKKLQLQILEKWYPIGSMVGLGDGKYDYEIIEYVQQSDLWCVRVVNSVYGPMITNHIGYLPKSGMTSTRNPLGLYLHPDTEKMLKRQSKLDKILNK